MATSSGSFYVLSRPCSLRKAPTSLNVRAQRSGDKGKSANIVDANMKVLRQRIDEVRMHERLKNYCRGGEGWNYTSGYDCKLKKEKKLSESLEVAGLMAGTFGCTLLSSTIFLCLVSLLVHMGH